MADQEVDLYALSDDDFLKHMEAAQAAEAAANPPVTDDRPRDAQGRFIAQEAVVAGGEEVDEVVYRREIDLGDGAGKQVFEGSTMDELVDALATAQEHASRKIRELSAAKKTVVVAEPEASADEEWLMSQELMATPSKAFNKLFEKNTGTTVEEFKADLQEVRMTRKEKREAKAADSFMETHPEYIPNQHNGGMLQTYLQTLQLEGTPENIEKAYSTLSAGGLLQLKDGTEVTEDAPETPTRQRIAAPAGVKTVVIQKKAASGLSAKRSVSSPVQPTEQDLYNMPEKEFFALGGVSQDNW